MNCLKDTLESWREANKMVHWHAEDLKQWVRGLVQSKHLREELLVLLQKEIDLGHEDFYARVKDCKPFKFEQNEKVLNLTERRILKEESAKQDGRKGPQAYMDNIYGSCELHPVLVVVIETPIFERLRNINQLGTSIYVYATGNGNRYVHCIGTAILAKTFLDKLFKDESDRNRYGVNDTDLLCVQIAALIHDLGHGPWSHLFDGTIIRDAIKEFKSIKHPHDANIAAITDWDHEMGSQMLFEYLLHWDETMNDGTIRKTWLDYGIDLNTKIFNDKVFIKELIDPTALKNDDGSHIKDNEPWTLLGRPEEKAMLYEIVSNKRSGLDVDKLDYLKRDLMYCKGVHINTDYNRLFDHAKVMECPDNPNRSLIAFDRKVDIDILEIFKTRETNHRQIYQHRENQSAELLISDALKLIRDSFFVTNDRNQLFKLHEAIHDPSAYCKLNEDYIFQNIMNPGMFYHHLPREEQPKWDEAKKRLEQILKNKLPACLAHLIFKDSQDRDDFWYKTEVFKEQICDEVNRKLVFENPLTPDDLVFKKGPTYDWGMKNESPLEKVPFFEKNSKKPQFHNLSSTTSMFPANPAEFGVRLFNKRLDCKNESCEAFDRICREEKLKIRSHQEQGPTTPMRPGLTPLSQKRCAQSPLLLQSQAKRALKFKDDHS